MEESTRSQPVDALLSQLGSNNGLQREQARKALVAIGKPAVGPLLALLDHKEPQVRWEACKALVSLRDPRSSGAMVTALEDDNVEIRWLAAEVLIALKRDALVPLLTALEHRFTSDLLRQGAHHVLHALEREGLLNLDTRALLDGLRSLTPVTPIAVSAHDALTSLGFDSGGRAG
jgi:HEAT repeat protein